MSQVARNNPGLPLLSQHLLKRAGLNLVLCGQLTAHQPQPTQPTSSSQPLPPELQATPTSVDYALLEMSSSGLLDTPPPASFPLSLLCALSHPYPPYSLSLQMLEFCKVLFLSLSI